MYLLVAPTPWEAKPLARALGLRQSEDGLYKGSSKAGALCLVSTGMGADLVRRRLQSLPPGLKFSAVFSVGLAGALQPELRSGDLVFDPSESPVGYLPALREAAGRANRNFHMGRILSSPRVLAPSEKRELGGARRAAAVDMEGEAIRAWARERRADFIAARAILDSLGMAIPKDAPESDGVLDCLRYALKRWRGLPLLIRTGWLQSRAVAGLGEFLRELFSEPINDEADDES